MDIEWIKSICFKLNGVSEDLKWDHNLCFCVKEKIFCILSLDETPPSIGIKVSPENFDDLVGQTGITPSPYLGRAKWISIHANTQLTKEQINVLIVESYNIIKAKLSKKIQKELD